MSKCDPGELDIGLPYPKIPGEGYPVTIRPSHYVPCLAVFDPVHDLLTVRSLGRLITLSDDERLQFRRHVWPERCAWSSVTHCEPSFMAMLIERSRDNAKN